nr:NACHT domain-containing protein [uncultured Vibrio sp.]
MSTGFVEKGILEASKHVAPSIKNWFSSLKEDYQHICEHTFLKFIDNQYRDLNLTTSILSGTTKIKISDIYVPLTLCKEGLNKKIDKFPDSLLKEHRKVIISDSAGMGKSTLLKMVYRYTIEEAPIIPFYIDLKTIINDGNVISIEEYILNNYPSFTKTPSLKFIKGLIEKNPYLFLFDGADEVPDLKKEEVFKSVNSFCNKAIKSNFIIASRKEDKILSSFPEFEICNIKPLSTTESELLILKCGKDKEISSRLIDELKKPQNESVKEFLRNPLLTTLLHAAYQYTKRIPLKKSLFFSQIFDALFEDHDSNKPGVFTREVKSGLTINEFEEVLSALAYDSRPKEQLEYSKSELNRFFKNFSDTHPTITFNSSKLIDDLIVSVPILKRDGLVYAWQHKSLQEYFFVRHVLTYVKETEIKKEIFKRISESKVLEKYKLIIDILYDEDKIMFHDVVTRSLNDYVMKNIDKKIENKKERFFDVFIKYYLGTPESIINDWDFNIDGDGVLNSSKLFFTMAESEKNIELEGEGYMLNTVMFTAERSISFKFGHSKTTILDVLFEKGELFIDNQITDELSINKSEIRAVKRIDEKPNLNEMNYFFSSYYYLDEEELHKFMSEFDENNSRYKNSSKEIPNF